MNLSIKKTNIILLSIALLSLVRVDAFADNGNYKIDFGVVGSQTATSTGWNNFYDGQTPSGTYGLIDTTGATSTATFTFTDSFTCGSGALGTVSSPLYPSSATSDYLSNGGCGDNTAAILFSGLSASYTYTIKAFSSRDGAGQNRILNMAIGAATSSVNAWNAASSTGNTLSVAQISNVGASGGNITVNFSNGASPNFYHLNVIEIIANMSNVPPVVNAGNDITITAPTNSITLNGTSTDSDGTITSRIWTMFSGDANAVITSSSSATTTVTNLYPGKYTFRLTAIDNNAASVTDDVTITVLPQTLPSTRPAKKIVILGSSTAVGFGTTPDATYENSWVKLFEEYIKLYNASSSIVNLGVFGYTTDKGLPNGYGTGTEDQTKNITAALALNPSAIILNYTTNDANSGFPIASSTQYIRAIAAAAQSAGVPVWITTSTGRDISLSGRNLLISYRDFIMSEYGTSTTANTNRGINIFSPVANADATVNATYGYGDGVHLNNLGHTTIYEKMVESNILATLYALPAGIPTSVLASVSGTSVTLTWSAPSNIDPTAPIVSYNLYNADTNALIATTSSSSISKIFTDLTKGNTYSYYVTATNMIGQSASSSAVSVQVPLDSAIPANRISPGSSSSADIPTSLIPFLIPVSPTAPSNSTLAPFSRSLSAGTMGSDVKTLQQYLNSKGFTVASAGPGSKGKETTFFGPATKAALIKFQKAMKITPAVGFFGPITRAAIK